jgi:thymidine kinase
LAQLYFRFGTMGAGKSIELLKIAYNYEEQGKRVLMFTSMLDSRYGIGKITSRIGEQRDAVVIDSELDIFEKVKNNEPHCVLVDEAQFLSRENVLEFSRVVDQLNIPVIAYGLKNDFQNNLFPGSEALLIYADKLEEVKTVCWYCNRKATMVLRLMNGAPVFEGEQIQLGGNDTYMPVCRRCYIERLERESQLT